MVGGTYDGAGNLTNDGTTSYSYGATNDLTGTTTTGRSRAYSVTLSTPFKQVLVAIRLDAL